jgi:hypothetical protein
VLAVLVASQAAVAVGAVAPTTAHSLVRAVLAVLVLFS